MSFFNFLTKAGIEVGQAGIRNVDDLIRNVVLPNVMMRGDDLLTEQVIKEAQNLGMRNLPRLPSPGLSGESPQAVNQAIDALRRSQAPRSVLDRTVKTNNPLINRTSPVAPIGPRTRGGDIVPVNPQAAPAPRREIPSEPFMRPTVENVPVVPSSDTRQLGLDLRFPAGARSSREVMSSKGAIRPEGSKVGGQFYNPEAASVEDLRNVAQPYTGFRNSPMIADPFLDGQTNLFTPKSQVEEAIERFNIARMGGMSAPAGRQAPVPEFGRGALVRSGMDDVPVKRFRAPVVPSAPRASAAVDPVVPMNSATGARQVDLSKMLSDPRILAALGATGLGAVGVGMMNQGGGEEAAAPQAPVSQDPDLRIAERLTGDLNANPLFREPDGSALGGSFSEQSELGRLLREIQSKSGANAGSNASMVTSGNDQRGSAAREAAQQYDPVAAAVMRATEPMSPEKYGSAAEYYAARQDYASQPSIRAQLASQMEGDMATWAKTYPALAYELQRRSMSNPQANQQSVESVTTPYQVGTEMGSQVENNAPANAFYAGEAAVTGEQGAQDLKSATDPILNAKSLNLIQSYLDSASRY
jgi:hypothetical protein